MSRRQSCSEKELYVMKKSTNSLIPIGLMLFALFFGAGNLIFPVFMGQNSGVNTIPATIGFLLTGVGLPFPDPSEVRRFLHRPPVYHHWAGLRHAPYCHHVL